MIEVLSTGVPVVISAPSGAGKTSLCRHLLTSMPNVAVSVSHTTRPARPDEVDGQHYHFVDEPAFQQLVADDAFLEWAEVHGRHYGTARAPVESALRAGQHVLFDIDVQGGRQILQRLMGAVLVFVLPPSMKTLEARLRGRGGDSEAQISRRLAAARAEIEAADFYHYWLVNDDFDTAARRLREIVEVEALRRIDRGALRDQLMS